MKRNKSEVKPSPAAISEEAEILRDLYAIFYRVCELNKKYKPDANRPKLASNFVFTFMNLMVGLHGTLKNLFGKTTLWHEAGDPKNPL